MPTETTFMIKWVASSRPMLSGTEATATHSTRNGTHASVARQITL